MAIAVRSMWDPFTSLVRQFDTEFDTLARRAFGGERQAFVPAADIVRDGGDVVVTLELPGVDIEKDVEVEVTDGRLLVTGKRDEERTQEEGGFLVRETRSGQFRREFALPDHVTANAVEASYDRGLLRIRVRDVTKPKAEPRKIAVRAERPAVEGSTES